MKLFRFAGAIVMALGLSACDLPSPEEIADRIADRAIERGQEAGDALAQRPIELFERDRDDLADVPNTAFRDMPQSGLASFTGSAQLIVGRGNDRERYVGRTNVGIDYGRGQFIGRVDNFVARGDRRDIGGDLRISDSAVGVNRPNDFTASYSGTLRDGDDRIVVDAEMLGDFKGTPIRGMVGTGRGDGVTVNGADTFHRFDMIVTAK